MLFKILKRNITFVTFFFFSANKLGTAHGDLSIAQRNQVKEGDGDWCILSRPSIADTSAGNNRDRVGNIWRSFKHEELLTLDN